MGSTEGERSVAASAVRSGRHETSNESSGKQGGKKGGVGGGLPQTPSGGAVKKKGASKESIPQGGVAQTPSGGLIKKKGSNQEPSPQGLSTAGYAWSSFQDSPAPISLPSLREVTSWDTDSPMVPPSPNIVTGSTAKRTITLLMPTKQVSGGGENGKSQDVSTMGGIAASGGERRQVSLGALFGKAAPSSAHKAGASLQLVPVDLQELFGKAAPPPTIASQSVGMAAPPSSASQKGGVSEPLSAALAPRLAQSNNGSGKKSPASQEYAKISAGSPLQSSSPHGSGSNRSRVHAVAAPPPTSQPLFTDQSSNSHDFPVLGSRPSPVSVKQPPKVVSSPPTIPSPLAPSTTTTAPASPSSSSVGASPSTTTSPTKRTSLLVPSSAMRRKA